ncbi:hypothetical protein CO038_04765 [Candidatus Pacearchaeota archaeon CG_4_9_14_0_2_um_filter_39_13]|nr:hypothetical protein [Candidatus Pacearchaeota archaeon]PJC44241.1 MAG: hypothetical protein CO038_04765 [Candidatus Pacearchaeota archaeon CG_4_9_14_0_2_um_filter_39_13]
MKREALRHFLLALLLVVIALFFILPDKVDFSPQEFDLTELEPENLLSFYIRFAAESMNGVDSRIMFSPQEATGENLLPNANQLSCGEAVCQSFKAEVIIEDIWDEFDLLKEEDRERWFGIFNRLDVQAAISRVNNQVKEFVDSIECPGGCSKELSSDFSINIIPLDIETGECRGETNLDFITEGKFWVPAAPDENSACLYAMALAIQKGHRKINEIAKQTCGENCGFTIEGLSATPLGCESAGILKDWRKVKVHFKDKLKCSGQSSTGRYKLEITANVCVTCSGNPINSAGGNLIKT